MSAIGQANALLSNVAKIGFALVGAVAVWLGYEVHSGGERRALELSSKAAEVDRLTAELRSVAEARQRLSEENGRLAAEIVVKQKEIERLGLALRLSRVERRVARLVVLDQTREGAEVTTRVRFEEVDADGAPLSQPIEAALPGAEIYVDALVVKFEDQHIERADPLRGASLVLFRRLFSGKQAPEAGVALDRVGERPAVYGPGGAPETEAFEREIFSRFWDLAHDPRSAAASGVRAAHGEAPSMQVRKGEVYRITARASGGLTIELDRPAAGGQ
jgi:hypothetical protein